LIRIYCCRWEKKLKEKKVTPDDIAETESLITDGKVICVAEIVDPVDLFFTPFCVHAVNKLVCSKYGIHENYDG
jgi:hypothetical protein